MYALVCVWFQCRNETAQDALPDTLSFIACYIYIYIVCLS